MTVRATLKLEKGREKRAASRKTLRLLATGRRADDQATEVLIHDLSEHGMLIESASALGIDEPIVVELPGGRSCEAAVVWSSSQFYGCRFAAPLSPATISAALLKAVPATDRSIAEDDSPTAAPSALAARLTELRERRGFSIAQMATRLGVSRQALWYWETGQRAPRKNLLQRIAREFGVSERDLTLSAEDRSSAPGSIQALKELVAAQCGVASERVKIAVEF